MTLSRYQGVATASMMIPEVKANSDPGSVFRAALNVLEQIEPPLTADEERARLVLWETSEGCTTGEADELAEVLERFLRQLEPRALTS